MSGCRRPSGARVIAPSVRALGMATLVTVAGCSSDVTRFNLLGGDFFGTAFAPQPAPPPSSVAYAPPGYGPPGYGSPSYAPPGRTAPGHGLQETALPPLSPGQDAYRPPGRDYSASAPPYPPPRPEPLSRSPDRGPPWTDRARPPWTDKDATARSGSDEPMKRMYTRTEDSDRAVVNRVSEVAAERGLPQAQIALAWVLSKPLITSPIIGATKPGHLEDALAALDVKLSPEEIARLEEPYVPHPTLGFE